MRVVKASSIEDDAIKILIFAPSGHGKTFRAATMPDRTLVISAEAGLLSLKKELKRRGKDVDVIDISIDDDGEPLERTQRVQRLGEVYEYLTTEEAQKSYDNIFIDSITEISDNMIELLKTEFPDRSDSLVMYGENSTRMRSLIKAFRDLNGYNVIFTSLTAIDKDESGKRFVGVDMVGKISQQIHQFFDEVFYLDVITDEEGESQRIFQTGPNKVMKCKDRSGELDFYEPADLEYIMKKIRGEDGHDDTKSSAE